MIIMRLIITLIVIIMGLTIILIRLSKIVIVVIIIIKAVCVDQDHGAAGVCSHGSRLCSIRGRKICRNQKEKRDKYGI